MESIIQTVGKYYDLAKHQRGVTRLESLDESTFRAIGSHKSMVPALSYSENGMWRQT